MLIPVTDTISMVIDTDIIMDMAKYIVNIILVTACLFTYTSCIRKMNLYDENRNTGQDNNEKDTDSTPVYMYPFDKETANVTAEIIIHTKK